MNLPKDTTDNSSSVLHRMSAKITPVETTEGKVLSFN